MTLFNDTLKVQVTLTSGETSAHVDGGNVKHVRLDLKSYGHDGEVRIWCVVQDGQDDFFALVTKPDLLEIEVSVAKNLYDVTSIPTPLEVRGVVTSRSMREIASKEETGKPALYREYLLAFADPAQALWGDHRPSVIYSKTKLQKVFQENTPSKVSVETGWSALQTTRPIVCLGLGNDSASFYDFAFWLADNEYGHVWYDYTAQKLVFGDDKPNGGETVAIGAGAISGPGSFRVRFPRWHRAAVQLVNSRDGSTQKLEVTQPTAVDGVRRDYLVHTPVEATAAARQALEQKRYAPGVYEVVVDCDAYPQFYIAPGKMATLGGDFSGALMVSDTTFRVVTMRLEAEATNQTPEFDIENEFTEYAISVELGLETSDDPTWRGPAYRTPRYPVEVEGKVLSAVGQSGDRTYTVFDGDAAVGVYQVNFPNWNSTITIAVTPDFLPGHLYFPVNKDSRVFVSLMFDSARISRYLDWGQDVVVPNASQGNHLLLGRNQQSETSIMHSYVDGEPQLVIGRVNSGDQGTVTVKEGVMILELTDSASSNRMLATVSVEPEAQLAAADAQGKGELAVEDLQAASDAASQKLTGSAVAAASAIQKQTTSLRAQVDKRAREVDVALQRVSQGIDAQVQQVNDVISDVRAQIDDLLE